MDRLTFEGNFCDISMCNEHPCRNFPCMQRKVWERLKRYEDQIEAEDVERERADELYKMALATWGPHAQTLMVFEEMSELKKELCKFSRGKDNIGHIAEEIADVQIMLEQMIALHDCEKLVEDWREEKLLRLADCLKTFECK